MKSLKFIQINIYKGKYLDALIDFLKQEDPDFVSMQEVTYGDVSYYDDKDVNIFEYIKEKTGLEGYFSGNQKFADSPKSLFGNAVLTKCLIKDVGVLTLKEFRPVTLAEFENSSIFPILGRSVVDVTVNFLGLNIHALSWL